MGRKKLEESEKNKTKLIIKGLNDRSRKIDIKVEFKAPAKNPLYKKFKGEAIIPIFNVDGKFFTPTFVLKHSN